MRRGEPVVGSRITFTQLAARWLVEKPNLRPSSRAWYELALRRHVCPRIGRLRVADVSVDDIARLVAELQTEGYAGSTITNILIPAGQVFDRAVRRGLMATNPVRRLERHERPRIDRNEMRILDGDEITTLLQAARHPYRTLLATAIFTGLRSGELLGLQWQQLDFDKGLVRVRHQVDRTGQQQPLKTQKGRRDVLLTPALASLLREHRLRSPHSVADAYVFARDNGRPMHPDTVRRCGLQRTMLRAGLDQPGKPPLRFHDLRHTYASLLIAQGVNVAFVSRQLGHASITTTLNVYTHLFDHAEHAASVIERLEDRFGDVLRSTGERSELHVL